MNAFVASHVQKLLILVISMLVVIPDNNSTVNNMHTKLLTPTGEATTIDPILSRKRNKLWTGQVPCKFLDEVLLVRNVGLTALGSLTPASALLAANLKIAHQVGA